MCSEDKFTIYTLKSQSRHLAKKKKSRLPICVNITIKSNVLILMYSCFSTDLEAVCTLEEAFFYSSDNLSGHSQTVHVYVQRPMSSDSHRL